jgi:hypothetical protein
MFKAKLFDHISQTENEIDLQDFTGLKLGQRVTHRNAGQHGGNGTTISSQLGTVVGFDFQGEYSWGGACVTVDVLWDDKTKTRMVYSLAKAA